MVLCLAIYCFLIVLDAPALSHGIEAKSIYLEQERAVISRVIVVNEVKVKVKFKADVEVTSSVRGLSGQPNFSVYFLLVFDISFFPPQQPPHKYNICHHNLLNSAIRVILNLRALVSVFLYLLRFCRWFLHLFAKVADLTRLHSCLLNSIYLNPAQRS